MNGLIFKKPPRAIWTGLLLSGVLLLGSLLPGCVQPKILKYEPFQNKSYSRRSKPAEYYDGSPEAIMRDGYLLIGYIDIKRNIRACYDDFTCKNISTEYPPRNELQTEAAERGGDRVSLLEERIGLEKATKSVCNSYRTQTYTVEGKTYTTTVCSSYSHYQGHREIKVSKALVWRNDAQLATPEANLAAIRQAMGAMAKAYGVNPEKPQVAAESKPASEYLDLLSDSYTDTREGTKNPFGVSGSQKPTGLLKAISDDDPVAIRKEIGKRASEKWTANHRRSAITYAILKQKPKAIDALIANKFYELDRDNRGFRPVAYAAAVDDLTTVKRLVKLGSNPKGTDNKGQSLLHSAVGSDGSKTVAWLLGRGLDPNQASENGFTPLIRAAHTGNTGAARLLLKAGAKPNVRIKKSGGTALMGAASKDSAQMIRLLVQNGAKVNARNKKKMTALSFAAANGNNNSVRHLLKSGANINALSSFGTPLRMAVRAEKWDTATLLVKRGASLTRDKSAKDKWLAYAVSKNQHEFATALLKRGVKPNAQKPHPVTLAAKTADGKMIRLLAAYGADMNARYKSASAMMIAARNGNESVVKELLAQNVRQKPQASKGLGALDVATIYGHTGVVRAIREAGSNQ